MQVNSLNHECIPIQMRNANRWLLWRAEYSSYKNKKARKVPYYSDGSKRRGVLDSKCDQAKLVTYKVALNALQTGRYAGLGFALGPDGTGNYWQGVDLDNLPNHQNLEIIAQQLPGYKETSPSGNGLHAIGYGRYFKTLGSNQSGVEAYASSRFFTVTSKSIGENSISCIADFVERRLSVAHKEERFAAPSLEAETQTQIALISEETIEELRSALLFMRSDDRDLWVKIGHSLKTLGDIGRDLFMEWSATSDKFDARNDSKTWDSFKPNRTVYQSVFSEAKKRGWKNPDLLEQSNSNPIDYKTFDLDSFALNGDSKKMEEKMLADKFVLGQIAILGQSTVIYAKPNHGKTLLMIWLLIKSIEINDINPNDVFYINADDNHKGATQKLKLAEKYGFKMLVPGYKGFNASKLSEYLSALIEQDAAHGKILILDTLKKFTDVMDKKKGSAFGESTRQFVSHGGTVIMLAHTNKHRNTEGNLVFSGTSDLVDDSDATYTLDIVEQRTETGIRTVKFINFKNRGDNALEEIYEYNFGEGLNYLERLNSVRAVNPAEKSEIELRAKRFEIFNKNLEAVTAITQKIMEGVTKKTELIKAAMDASGLSKKTITRALLDHTGESLKEHYYWRLTVKDKNSHVYQLNTSL